ncbi:MAG TPA: bifunctional serine/threonine-protein kinase/formylglycine-generating enzyme family protein [Kofleriaceae bacterium]|nr:bifunctional serine/threonine-protein kinase/formylglycine-generating enzyme family protein [Kofleriaceae bacterium]
MSRLSSSLPEGIALLVAGAPPPGAARDPATAQALGQIGEALLATGSPWRIRRLSAGAGERYAPDRANLKRFIDELAQPADVAILVASAEVTTAFGEPAIVTGDQHRDYPSEATLPLSWVRARLSACAAERVLVLLSARHGDDPAAGPDELAAACLGALGTTRPGDVIAIDATGDGTRAIDALLAGLCGQALDPRTGTVTLRSIGEHLARSVPRMALQASPASETLAVSPPLGGLWTVRASGAQRAAVSRAADDEPHDLAGVVLPGRFQIERALASGTFGTVYRARQLSVQRDVAVKVLHAGIDPTSEDGRLFVHEIQAVGRIDHPNVVRIHQADITPSGRLFFAMELLVGRDLQQIVNDERTLPHDRAVSLTRQLLAGLGAAHDAGLVHADVKPANAFVAAGRDGERVVLLDFGLARLRPPGRPAESAGGTPAYMAPEQLHDGRVDARSDLFSAAMVLVTLLTGWRRTRADHIVPPLEPIEDAQLRAALERALAPDPADRYQTAAELADALAGHAPGAPQEAAIRAPFRHLAPFTERDRGRLHGREHDLDELTEHVLYRRAVVYTAPSGAGKTSLLRAGLVPHLESLGARPVYLACRDGAAASLASAIRPGAAGVADAVASWHGQNRNRKLVLIADQLEAALSGDRTDRATGVHPAGHAGRATVDAARADADAADADILDEALAFDRWPADADVSVVLSVREDFLARVVGGSRRLDEGIPILRLGPLTRDGARAAIAGPLAEQRLAIAPDLLEALLADLEAAARAISPEMGWGPLAAAYPPHLQLACSVLYEALGPGEATLTLDHYRRLGGFDAIVGEHLDRVLDSELDQAEAAIARDLFLTLVSAAQTRAHRSEAELIDIVGSRHGAGRVSVVLEALRARGLLVRLRAAGGEPSWELVHDSLVPRVLAWIDRRDLDRRRAVEMLRHHLRRSSPDEPSQLSRAELRELRAHPDAVSELEAEWSRRSEGGPWPPAVLVRRSRRILRRRSGVLAALGLAALAVTGVALTRWRAEVAQRLREQSLRDRDMGRFVLELAPFDLDASTGRAVPVRAESLPSLGWRIHEVDPDDEDDPGAPLPDYLVVRGQTSSSPDGLARIQHVEARAGSAFLIVDGRGRAGESCRPSIIPLHRLPGYAQRERAEPRLRVRVPTCQATREGMVAIPAGPFVRGGLGQPPSQVKADEQAPPEKILLLPVFHLDRTEVTNAAFQRFAETENIGGNKMPVYPDTMYYHGADGPDRPVAGVNWKEARAYCRFMGKDLPTTEQWEKSARGGLVLADGSRNPMPRRNLPWGEPVTPVPARINVPGSETPAGTVAVGSRPGDVSPYGILDLAGNVQEWTVSASPSSPGMRITRGGNWDDTKPDDLHDMMAIDNIRLEASVYFYLGMRCALSE